jgi:signal transduction histidine kinase
MPNLSPIAPTAGVLDAVHEAALAVTSELSLPIVLNRIVTLARDLVGAHYAALAVPGPDGTLEQFVYSGITKEEAGRVAYPPLGRGMLGALLDPQARPIRLRCIQDDPRSVGFPPGHPHMTSFLGVPIVSRGELLGNLYLTDKIEADDFSPQDERLIQTLAAYAAVAIENARLYQQVQRLAVLEERDRIGMDLHDGIIQSIYAVGLTLEYAAVLLDEDKDETRERLTDAIRGLNDIIKDIRNYILDLRPQSFQGGDLEDALRNLMHEFRANTLAEIELDYDPQVNGSLGDKGAAAAFHIAQEAMANAAKHAAATHLKVSVRKEGGFVTVCVADNGRGFLIEATQRALGHGLSNIDLRARSVGGHSRVESAIGAGTRVTARLPVSS